MPDYVIQCQDLIKCYGGKTVLNKINFAIDRGEFVGLVGINGAGKTTLIKSLLDLCSIDSGSIALFGGDHRVVSSRDNISYLPERFLPPSYFKGQDFIRFTMQLHGRNYNSQEILAKLDELGLEHTVLAKSVKTYSKGMAQKLGLAACFLSKKKLLILDEPMSGLDPLSRRNLKKILRALKSEDYTVFMSTHMLADVQTICDRMIVLHDGHIKFDSSPSAFSTIFAADDLDDAFIKCIS